MRYYVLRTENTYTSWACKYILFHNGRQPKNMGTKEINALLTHLALEEDVASSTLNQALSAILFLYRYVFNIELDQNTLICSRPKKKKIRSNSVVTSLPQTKPAENQHEAPKTQQCCPACLPR
ncbi:MAG: phage integrase N-terminal SAM-like domain-containing protein [Anaerolineaceae bacterium]|nr:phage integrase N-terminal SAM-like domain-containing protein [Anaerolineaceae bacterium]